MTVYRTCAGCAVNRTECATLDALKKKIAGLGVTSLKWRCADRRDKYSVGQAVWATTHCGETPDDYSPVEDEMIYEFPAVVIKNLGTRAIVYIAPSTPERYGDAEFTPRSGGRGFCKIPIARLSERDAPSQAVCKSCGFPETLGHHTGWLCSPDLQGMEL